MIHSNTNSPVSNNLAHNLVEQAEALDAISQLLELGARKEGASFAAIAKSCGRDIACGAQALRIVAGLIEQPNKQLGSTTMPLALRQRIAVWFAGKHNEADIGELLEDYASCAFELAENSLSTACELDHDSLVLMQAHLWLRNSIMTLDPLMESIYEYWRNIESQELAA